MRSLPSCGLGLALVTLTPLLFAQDQPNASDVALARSLGLEGVQLAEAGNCSAAIDKFQRAEALFHAPTILVRLGECQVATGKVVAGTENLQRVVRESLPPKAPKAFADAQVRAQKSLDAALPKVAKLKIHVDMPQGVRPLVRLDGEPLSLAALDVDRPADPGPHQIEVSAPGFKTAKSDTTLAEGGSAQATLRLEPDPTAGAPPPGMAPYPPGAMGPPPPNYGAPPPNYGPPQGPGYPPPAAEQKGSSKTLGIVLLGVGGAGVAVGSIFGGIALSKKSALDQPGVCSPKSNCNPTAQQDIDDMNTTATVSTVAFAIGGGALLGGVIALVAAKSPSTSGATEVKRASVSPIVGPRLVGVQGSF